MVSEEIKEIARKLIVFSRRIYERNLTYGCGGNLSMRINDKIFITPSKGLSRTMLDFDENEVIILDESGNVIHPCGAIKPSIEMRMHLLIYKNRKDVNAIIHAHPPYTIIASRFPRIIEQAKRETGEFYWTFVTVPYYPPGSSELATAVANAAEKTDIIILIDHGIVTLGKTLEEAYVKLEEMEMRIKITIIRHLIRASL